MTRDENQKSIWSQEIIKFLPLLDQYFEIFQLEEEASML